MENIIQLFLMYVDNLADVQSLNYDFFGMLKR
jgi:hypothetical protein